MKVNAALRKMRDGKPAFGYSLGLGSPLVAEMISATGIDFVFIDTQHGSWGQEQIGLALMAVAAGGSVPMARVARNDYTLIGRLLDEGAMGIIVPLVHTAADAKAAADACRIPPAGTRSWGWGAASRYGADYPERINDELFVAVQIESLQAVENAEAIMATPGVDGCWVGPADLALSIGIHPSNAGNDDRHARALERVIEACRNTGKIPGFAAFNPNDAKRRAEQGFIYLTAGSDSGFLLGGARAGIETLGLSASADAEYM
jgi:4-hydroxy-2-oxoheptanedioate aldolase